MVEEVGVRIRGDASGLRADAERVDRTAIQPREKRVKNLIQQVNALETRARSLQSLLAGARKQVREGFARGAIAFGGLQVADSLGLNQTPIGAIASGAVSGFAFATGGLAARAVASGQFVLVSLVSSLLSEAQKLDARISAVENRLKQIQDENRKLVENFNETSREIDKQRELAEKQRQARLRDEIKEFRYQSWKIAATQGER